ncbi:MAG: hypothetical protein HYY17_15495 [Planctomycetes bacterium]|nr:hypothetical protein [Planctomycetota bacterium]
MTRRTRERGTALLLTVIVISMILGLSVSYFTIVMGEARTQHSTSSGTGAFYVAEAGLAQAVMELRTAQDIDGNGVVGACAGSFNGSPYTVTMTDMGDGTLELVAVASVNGTARAIEVRVASAPPVPVPGLGAQAALAFLGKTGKKAKIALHMHKPHEEFKNPDADGMDDDGDEDLWTSTSASPIAIDGNDAAGVKPNLPGLGIEDPVAYEAVTDRVAHDMYHNKILPDTIIGDPMATITSKKHGGITESASIAPLQTNPTSLNYENMNVIADQIEVVVGEMSTAPGVITIAQNNYKFQGETTYGNQVAPATVVIDAEKVEVTPGATVTGYGTLIVRGDMSILNNAKFNWTGDIVVLGGSNRDAVFRNKHGELTVNGTVIVLAGDENKKKATMRLDNDTGKHDGSTVINGALLVWNGNETKTQDKAEFKAKHGDFEINGFIGVYGDKVKFDAKMDHHHHDHADPDHEAHKPRHKDGSFVVHGGVVVAVPGNDEKHKVKVHLHGDDILIQYDSVAIENAIMQLVNFGQLFTPPMPATYQVISWRRIVPAVAGQGYGTGVGTGIPTMQGP